MIKNSSNNLLHSQNYILSYKRKLIIANSAGLLPTLPTFSSIQLKIMGTLFLIYMMFILYFFSDRTWLMEILTIPLPLSFGFILIGITTFKQKKYFKNHSYKEYIYISKEPRVFSMMEELRKTKATNLRYRYLVQEISRLWPTSFDYKKRFTNT